jgi:hypothetical protein
MVLFVENAQENALNPKGLITVPNMRWFAPKLKQEAIIYASLFMHAQIFFI